MTGVMKRCKIFSWVGSSQYDWFEIFQVFLLMIDDFCGFLALSFSPGDDMWNSLPEVLGGLFTLPVVSVMDYPGFFIGVFLVTQEAFPVEKQN